MNSFSALNQASHFTLSSASFFLTFFHFILFLPSFLFFLHLHVILSLLFFFFSFYSSSPPFSSFTTASLISSPFPPSFVRCLLAWHSYTFHPLYLFFILVYLLFILWPLFSYFIFLRFFSFPPYIFLLIFFFLLFIIKLQNSNPSFVYLGYSTVTLQSLSHMLGKCNQRTVYKCICTEAG